MESPIARAIRDAYAAGAEDEKMEPFVLVDGVGKPLGRFEDGDSVIFYDLRGEREIELTESLTDSGFDKFPVKRPLNLSFATLIEYDPSLNVRVAFPPQGDELAFRPEHDGLLAGDGRGVKRIGVGRPLVEPLLVVPLAAPGELDLAGGPGEGHLPLPGPWVPRVALVRPGHRPSGSGDQQAGRAAGRVGGRFR